MEIGEVRKRLRLAIDRARRDAAARRERAGEAGASFDAFLTRIAAPVFRQIATTLNAEGHPFRVFSPAGGLRLTRERATDDFIELALDAEPDPPVVLVRVSYVRGRRLITAERPLRAGVAIEELSDEDVLDGVLREIQPLVER